MFTISIHTSEARRPTLFHHMAADWASQSLFGLFCGTGGQSQCCIRAMQACSAHWAGRPPKGSTVPNSTTLGTTGVLGDTHMSQSIAEAGKEGQVFSGLQTGSYSSMLIASGGLVLSFCLQKVRSCFLSLTKFTCTLYTPREGSQTSPSDKPTYSSTEV